jgi:hypothetical protein
MYSEVHANYAFYKSRPAAGNRYRQIAVIEKEQFELRIFEGDVVQTDPKFIANSSDAELYFHPDLRSALNDAEKECKESVAAGWNPYDSSRPR